MLLDTAGRPIVHSNALLSQLPRSVRSAALKFTNVAQFSPVSASAFFDDPKEFQRSKLDFPEGAIVSLVTHEDAWLDPADFVIAGWRTMECLGYDDGWFHLFLTRNWQHNVNVRLPKRPMPGAPSSEAPTFLAYFTDDEIYGKFAAEFVEYHREAYPGARFAIAWFGDGKCPVEPDERMLVRRYPRSEFTEAFANNAILEGWESIPDAGYVLRLDGDTRLSPDAYRKLVYLDTETPGEGLWNLKHDEETGCGLIFARADVLRGKRYFETWPGAMYHADTEFLAHMTADHGVVPKVAFLGFDREEHERPWTDERAKNVPQLARLMLYGRDAVRDGSAPFMPGTAEAQGPEGLGGEAKIG